jgi:hypothetical protein
MSRLAEKQPALTNQAPPIGTDTAVGRSILVVDDEQNFVTLLEIVLTKRGFESDGIEWGRSVETPSAWLFRLGVDRYKNGSSGRVIALRGTQAAAAWYQDHHDDVSYG